MVVNRNGIVFSGTSQVNTRNLVAAAVGMSDAQFRQGIYSAKVDSGVQERMTPAFGNDLAGAGDAATFSKATGDVRVEAGARIQTGKPESVTQGGGYVLLLGRETHNAGQITTPGGQTLLAAGDSFIIRKGLASDANSISTTRGNEVSARRRADSEAGLVANTGLIQAPTGDVTLTGHDVRQLGVAVSSTTVTTRGTVHLLNSASDTGGKIVLGRDSATAILLEADGGRALDAQRDALLLPASAADGYRAAGQAFDHLSSVPDRRDQSRIEVTSGGTVQVEGGAMALATGGQIAVSAARRTPAGKRRGPGRGRRGRRQARHGVEQRQSQYPGQRTARCAGQPGRQDTEQHRCLGGQAHADPDRQGRQRLRAGALVYAGRPAGSGRLSGHHRAWRRRMGGGGRHRHRGGRRAGESRRLPDQHPAARWTCRAAISGKAGCAARTAGCTKYRVRREICCTRACTRASRMSMRVGATRARAISTTR